jgi:hypothetical protein
MISAGHLRRMVSPWPGLRVAACGLPPSSAPSAASLYSRRGLAKLNAAVIRESNER